MKKVVWLVLVLVAAFVAAERIPALRAKLPWLPNVPGLTNVADTGQNQAAGAPDTTGGRRRGAGGGGRRGGGDGPTPVLVAAAQTADVPVTADVLGTVQATNNVTVRSQVDGKLIELDFQDGQDVTKGDVLARIDPAPFQATYDQAVAKKAQDEANLANSQADLIRYTKLAATQYGSAQQADTQKAQVAQNKALIQQDQAAIDSAKTTLDYATIRAPITGRTGIRLIDAGNVVHASDATGIVTIAEVRPIAAIFNLPQQLLGQINAAQAGGPPLKLEASSPDSHEVIETGTLQVIDNSVDQTTGTVKLKGSFPNSDLQLWPGQFVNLRLTISVERNVVVVPTPAIQRGPDGPFVFIVQPDATVHLQKVKVGRQTEDRSVIAEGLKPGDSVVTTGFTRLTDGAKVAVSKPTADAETKGPADAGQAVQPAEPNTGTDSGNRKARHLHRSNSAQAEGSAGTQAKPAPAAQD
ncbi:efflux RND transporter periplasmic adaptor subunit [Lichenifustis flavocetrariae]|uniref:Efflux RND transporter periplasmic adaptor subunit n=1 Tax=Lichenifustis flavocetrariae TaxID=2949735 RepID=A0AA41YYP5_9HYPH|nr:efflux RND transporter periplasmic adaptor subunit [Lichenifustis flavocetrariae]MCW6509731.1 efflux RND transporter periplasmic adaptor subunit [Lichenifustis flavocetrariae]